MSTAPTLSSSRFLAVLLANGLLRVAGAAGGALIGFYLAALAVQGRVADALLVGALGVVQNIAELGGAIPVGLLTDRYSARTILVLGALAGAGATQLFGLTSLPAVFFLSQALSGVAGTTGGPPLLALLSDATRGQPVARSRLMGFYQLSFLVGLALGGLVGGLLWDGFGTLAFALLAAVYLLVAALFAWGAAPLPARPQHTSRPAALSGLGAALRDPLLRRLAPAWVAVNAIIGLWFTQIGFLLSGPMVAGQYLPGRFSASQVGLIQLGFAAVFALGILGWTFALERLARLRVLRLGLAAMLLTCLWLFLLNSAGDWPVWLRWLLTGLAAVFVMIESGFTPAALAYLADIADSQAARGATMGIYTLLLGLGNALGAALSGPLAAYLAFNGLIVGTVGLLLVALLSLAFLPEHAGAAPLIAAYPLPDAHKWPYVDE
jgi:MFS family permease